jgi:GntR family transcriptional regulator
MEDTIQREYSKKLYIQLVEILKKKITSEEWPVGSQIPTEDELCKTYDVSRSTVRTAILELVRLGFLKRQQGRGTFVSRKITSTGLTVLTSFRELMLDAGINFSTKLLVRTMIMPTDGIDKQLGIPGDKHVIYVKRLRSVDKEPVLIKESYIPYHLCPVLLEEDVEKVSIFELLESRCGIRITKAKGYVEIAYLTQEEGALLKLPKGSPALLFTQQFFADETVVKFVRMIKRPDRFRYFLEVEKKPAFV